MRSFSGCSKMSPSAAASGAPAGPASGPADSVMLVFCLSGARSVNAVSDPGDSLPPGNSPAEAASGARRLGELQVTRVQCRDLIAYRAQAAVVADDVVGGLQTRRARGLRIQNRLRLRDRCAVTRAQASYLQLLLTVDHQHAIHVRAEVLLDQQRNDEDLVGAAGGGGAGLHRGADGGVRPSLQIPP